MIKELSLLKNLVYSNFVRLRSPYKITFAATYRCNLKCKICNIWDKPTRDELSCLEIEKIFKSLNNLNWIDLTGGEVTLREDLSDIIKLIIRGSKRLVIFHISTNGQLAQRAFLATKAIISAGITPVINISIDGPERVNDFLRGGSGAYWRSLETFRSIKRIRNARVYLSCTLSSLNIDYIDELITDLKKNIQDFDFSNLHFNIFHQSAHYYNNQNKDISLELTLHSLKKYLGLCALGNPVKVFLEKEYIKELGFFINNGRSSFPCQACLSTCFLNPYGEVFPCSIYNLKIGNLKENNFDINALWNCGKTKAVRKCVEENKCPGCWSPCEAYPAIAGHFLRKAASI